LEKMDQALASKDVDRYTHAHYRFHRSIASASGNRNLDWHLRLATQPFVVPRLTYIYIICNGHLWEANHHQILEALAQKDSKKAAELMRKHVISLLEIEDEVKQEL